jgi:thioredoxin reductase (NADPH)
MVTAEEVARVEVFAMLDAREQERIARSAADVTLLAGEDAASEGADPALFAVLAGRIEAVKTVDGVDRIVGERLPGDIFGEVPIVLGAPFPVTFRAAERSRVLRIAHADYHAIAAVDPIVPKAVGALAQFRMTGNRGLQALASEAPPPRATVVGERWDPAC